MFPKRLIKTKAERMPELRRIIDCYCDDGWKWYAWLAFATFKFVCVLSQTKFALDVSKDDFLLFAYAASTYFIPLLALVKLYSLLKHQEKIRSMFAVIKARFLDISIVNRKLSGQLNLRQSLISKVVAVHVYISIFICLVIATFPLVNYPDGRKRQPSALWFPFDTDTAPTYQIIYTILAVSNHVSVFLNLNYDSLYVYLAQTLSAQFAVLKDLLKNITEVPEVAASSRYRSEKYQRIVGDRLKMCVDHHDLLMRFSNDIEEIYSLSLAVQLSLSILSLVFTAYIVSMDHDDIVKMFKLLVYVLALTIQVLLYNLNGSEIESQHKTIALAASRCDWYYGDKSFKDGLLFLTMRSQKEFAINALGLASINNACIVTIYRTVFSILTVMKKVTQ